MDSSLSDYSPQHSPHSYFHVKSLDICIKLYAYSRIGTNENNKTNLLFAGKESSQQACDHRYNYTQEETNAGTKNDSFGKGFDVLKGHVLNR